MSAFDLAGLLNIILFVQRQKKPRVRVAVRGDFLLGASSDAKAQSANTNDSHEDGGAP